MLSADIPNSFYNINSKNNTLSFSLYDKANANTETSYTVTIDAGNYDSLSFVNAIKTAMNTPINTYLLTKTNRSTSSNIVSIAVNTLTIKLTISITQTIAGSTNELQLKFNASSMLNKMGFVASTNIYAISQTGTNLLDLRTIDDIYIYSSISNTISLDSSGKPGSILAKIQNNTPFGETVYYQTFHPELTRMNLVGSSIDNIRITLRDSDGNLLDSNGLEISLVLAIYL